MKIKAIIFDFGGVLLDYSFPKMDRHIAARLGKTDAAIRKITNKYGRRSHEGMTRLEYLKVLAQELHVDIRELKRVHTSAVKATNHIRPQVVKLVTALKKRGYRTPLISNVNAACAHIHRKRGWYNLFSPHILSYEVGCNKPDKHIYQIALRKLHLKPKECVFIDDKERCLKPARKLGMQAIKYTTLTNVKKKLKKIGVVW